MEKASKWIRNFLMGKREDKGKKTCTSGPAEPHSTLTVSNTPSVRRRWSFKASRRAKAIGHKSTRSFDSIIIPKQASLLLEYETQINNVMFPMLNANAAATKIQATYRSYLARRALRALRALVKLQALARGYLVRKQMNIVLRSIHAVMAIQVRARIQRIQMVEDSPVMVGRRKSYGEPSPSDRQLRKEISENTGDENSFATTVLRSRSERVVDHVPAERLEYGSRKCRSGRLSVSQREYHLKMSSSPSTLSFTDSSSTTYDGQLEEFSYKMARRNSRRYSTTPEYRHPFILPQPQFPDCTPSTSNAVPNYMTNTRSSEAKARSHSEPRQRPTLGTKQKSKRSSSMDEKNDQENQYPWLNKLHRSDKSTDDGVYDSYMSAMANVSKHMRSLNLFEPPMNLY